MAFINPFVAKILKVILLLDDGYITPMRPEQIKRSYNKKNSKIKIFIKNLTS